MLYLFCTEIQCCYLQTKFATDLSQARVTITVIDDIIIKNSTNNPSVQNKRALINKINKRNI